MSKLFPRNNLSDIQNNILIYYLSDTNDYNIFIKTLKRLRYLKHKQNILRKSIGKRKNHDIDSEIEANISMSTAINSLIIDSILFKIIKIS
jgi:hypothetical protein